MCEYEDCGDCPFWDDDYGCQIDDVTEEEYDTIKEGE